MPDQIGATVWTLAGLLLASTAALALYLHVHRRHQTVRASSPLFCHLMHAGCACLYTATGLSTAPASRTVCAATYVTGYVGFSLTTSALFSKTLRLALIFRNGATLQIVRIRDRDVLRYMVGMGALPMSVLAVWMAVDAPTATATTTFDGAYRYTMCRSRDSTWHFVMFAIEGVMLALGFGVTHQVRNAPYLFNESRWIAISIYNILAWAVVVAPLTMSSFLARPDVVIVLDAAALLLATAATQLLIFAPKVARVRSDAAQTNVATTGIGSAPNAVLHYRSKPPARYQPQPPQQPPEICASVHSEVRRDSTTGASSVWTPSAATGASSVAHIDVAVGTPASPMHHHGTHEPVAAPSPVSATPHLNTRPPTSSLTGAPDRRPFAPEYQSGGAGDDMLRRPKNGAWVTSNMVVATPRPHFRIEAQCL